MRSEPPAIVERVQGSRGGFGLGGHQVANVIQAIDQHHFVRLVASGEYLPHERQLAARVQADPRQHVNLPLRMRPPQQIREPVFHILDAVTRREGIPDEADPALARREGGRVFHVIPAPGAVQAPMTLFPAFRYPGVRQ